MNKGVAFLVCVLLHFCLVSEAQFVNADFNMPGMPGLSNCDGGTGWQSSPWPNQPEYTAYPSLANWHIDLTTCHVHGNGAWIQQSVATTPGKCYRLQVDLGSVCGWDGSDAGVNLFLNGIQHGQRIYNDTFICLPDTVCWKTRCSAPFIATGVTTTIRLVGEGRLTALSGPGLAGNIGNPGYMGVDNVKLIPADSFRQESTFLGNDTTACPPLTLAANTNATSYQWSTGDTSNEIVATLPGVYWVRAYVPCIGILIDTVKISGSSSPGINIPQQFEKCEHDTLELHAEITDAASVLWSTGDTTEYCKIVRPGKYWVFAENMCGNSSDTVDVIMQPEASVSLPDKMFLCSDKLEILAKATHESFLHWSTGDSTRKIAISDPGTYWVAAGNTCGVSSDTVLVEEQTPVELELPEQLSLCNADQVNIKPALENATSWRWSNGSLSENISVYTEGIYWLSAENGCGKAIDSVQVIDCDGEIWLPSVFSPNSDGMNDQLKVMTRYGAHVLNIAIFNRWGEQVFYTTDGAAGWDGYYKGGVADIGTYHFIIHFQSRKSGVSIKKGNIVVVR